MKLFLEIILLFTVVSIATASDVSRESLTLQDEKYIEQSEFNGVILVSKGGELIVDKYIGYADTKQKVPLDNRHIFSPGSVGKEFTTVGLMLLHEKGLLTYEDKISDYLSELPDWANEVTIHQILNHTSGFPKISWKNNISTKDAWSQIHSSDNAFEPGKGYLYSNLNVIIRALVIEKITKTPFAEFLQRYIFEPANMTDSYLQLSSKDISENKVVGDYPTFLNGVTIYVTPYDLMNFEKALTQGILVPFSKIKSKLEGDTLSGRDHRALYDFGSFYKNEEGELIGWKHDGSNPSHHTLKVHDFENDIIILIMSSDGNKTSLFEIKDRLVNNLESSGI